MKSTLTILALTALAYFSCSPFLPAQPEDLTQVWPAQWIAPANAPWKSYAMHRFRKTIELDTVPEQLVVHSSGDNRYQLFVNGERVTYGPQRGDLNHWYYESTDIAPYLKPGKNVLAVQVLNYGSHPPDAQMSVQTGFVLAADDQSFRFLNTGKGWKAIYDPSYSPNLVDGSQVQGYYGGGSREMVDGQQLYWGWSDLDYNDSQWPAAKRVESAFAKTCIWVSRWKLTPRTLPHETLTDQRFQSVRRSEGVVIPKGFPQKAAPVTIPAKTRTILVFDQGVMTTAYPVLQVSGGKGASIRLEYVEAPNIGPVKDRNKGHRGEIAGKELIGYYDQFTADGGKKRLYEPIWWRAFRYIEMTVETQEEPLVIEDFYSRFSTYPFTTEASFRIEGIPEAEQDTLDKILEVGERTIRLCAHDTYMDCPYYEESQFEGDTRVQALVSYVLFGDASLGKNAIEQFSWSLNSEGFLSARYPTNSTYYIPNYSLYWIGMLHDYMMYAGDKSFIRQKLPVARILLGYFLDRLREDGTVRRPDYHNFVDWAFPRGEAPFDDNGYSALVDLHLLLALQWAMELETYAGDFHYYNQYQSAAEGLMEAIPKYYWNSSRQLYTDTPEGIHYSTHTNHLAILTGIVQGEAAAQLMRRALTDTTLTQPTVYWQFYQLEALQAAGLGQEYLDNLGIWKTMLRAGVTTWPETTLRSRSECHAWGASPNYHLYTITAGVKPAAPGFEAVRVAPQLGEGQTLQCTHPHPKGNIKLALKKENGKLIGTVELPAGTTGELITETGAIELTTGSNRLNLTKH